MRNNLMFFVISNKFYSRLRQTTFGCLLLFSQLTQGQNNCAIGYIEGSNKIQYNEAEVEKLIDFSKYNAIFYGEGHVRDFEPEFKLHFIQHLHKRFKIKDVFVEIGQTAAYYFNQYLKTGDTSILLNHKMPYNIKSYRPFWYGLHVYNKNLPEASKIKIHGVDFERTEVLKLLAELKMKEVAIPEHLKPLFDNINLLNSDSSLFAFSKQFKNALDNVKSAFVAHENNFKLLYGDNFNTITAALKNNTPTTTRLNPRNKAWNLTMANAITTNKIEKFVAFFGGAHTRYGNSSSPSVEIKNLTAFNPSVLNIVSVYHNYFSYGYMGDAPKIFDYEHGKKDMYEQYADKNCRATFVAADKINNSDLKEKADYVLFAKDIVVE
jgi:hypothetical protein